MGASTEPRLAAAAGSLIDSLQDAVIANSFDGRITVWNPAAERMFGFKAQEALGQPIAIIVPPGYETEEADILERVRRGESVVQYETRRKRKDGSLVDVSLTLAPLREDDGTIMGVCNLARDVTDRRRIEQALRESEARLAQAQSVAHLGGWEWELASGRIEWSDEMFRIYGYPVRSFEPSFDKAMERVLPDDAARIRAETVEHLTRFQPPTQEHPGTEFRILHPERGVRLMRSTARLFGTEAGKPTRLVGTVQDVTEPEEVVRRRRELEELKRLDAFKSEFIGRAAHELRTPLLPIQIQAHLLGINLQQRGATKELGYLATLQRNLDRLNRLVDDLLEASRIQSDRLQLQLVPFDLSDLFDEIAQSFRPVAEHLGVRFVWRPRPGVPVEADPQRIIQVAHNLLGNAMKFTPAGGAVTLELTRTPEVAHFSVQDTGPGIPPDEQPRLFRPFEQASSGKASKAPGTGLGLYISKAIVEQHGGTIRVESGPAHQGARFIVELPITSKSPQPVSPAIPAGWWRDGGGSDRQQRYRDLI